MLDNNSFYHFTKHWVKLMKYLIINLLAKFVGYEQFVS